MVWSCLIGALRTPQLFNSSPREAQEFVQFSSASAGGQAMFSCEHLSRRVTLTLAYAWVGVFDTEDCANTARRSIASLSGRPVCRRRGAAVLVPLSPTRPCPRTDRGPREHQHVSDSSRSHPSDGRNKPSPSLPTAARRIVSTSFITVLTPSNKNGGVSR